MTKTERRNYQIAVLGSILIHGMIMLICVPEFLFHPGVTLKTYPVGMVELLPGSGLPGTKPPGEINHPVGQTFQPVAKTNGQPKKNDLVKQPLKDLPKTNPNSQAVSELNIKLPKSTALPLPTSAGNGPQTELAVGNIASQSPVPPYGLGNGEGKVFRLGALPLYPKNALNEGIEGEVILRILVLQDGGLERVDVLESSGDVRLDKASFQAINRWQFKPESRNYYIDLGFVFRIKAGVTVRFINAAARP
jgi:protein TonB